MPKDTPQVDHKAEALMLLEDASTIKETNPLAFVNLLEAHVHSNLAIAEGQERVARELERIAGREGTVPCA